MPTEMRIVSCAIPDDLDAGLRLLNDRYGTPASEAIRRALRRFLEDEGVIKRTPGPHRQRKPR
jgi:Arc/MetJ-type ribon-helix-helix transcriptional regulator